MSLATVFIGYLLFEWLVFDTFFFEGLIIISVVLIMVILVKAWHRGHNEKRDKGIQKDN